MFHTVSWSGDQVILCCMILFTFFSSLFFNLLWTYSVEITQVYWLFFSGDLSHPALLQILRRHTGKLHWNITQIRSQCSRLFFIDFIEKAFFKHCFGFQAAQLLARNENDDGLWRDVAKDVYADADHLFKTIGEAYNVLSDPDKVKCKIMISRWQ